MAITVSIIMPSVSSRRTMLKIYSAVKKKRSEVRPQHRMAPWSWKEFKDTGIFNEKKQERGLIIRNGRWTSGRLMSKVKDRMYYHITSSLFFKWTNETAFFPAENLAVITVTSLWCKTVSSHTKCQLFRLLSSYTLQNFFSDCTLAFN